jgi:hypothetical protein
MSILTRLSIMQTTLHPITSANFPRTATANAPELIALLDTVKTVLSNVFQLEAFNWLSLSPAG